MCSCQQGTCPGNCRCGCDHTPPAPHITELLDLTPAVDAALLGMTAHELKSQGDPDPDLTAAALWEATEPAERRNSRAIMLAAVYPAARLIAEQAYQRGREDQAEVECGADLPDNPFAEGAVIV